MIYKDCRESFVNDVKGYKFGGVHAGNLEQCHQVLRANVTAFHLPHIQSTCNRDI